MATMDAGVANLQRFIAHLAASTGALAKSADQFKQSGIALGEMEGTAAAEGGALNDELEELGSVVDGGRDEADDALGGLAEAATDAQGVIAEARAELAEAATETEEKTAAILGELGDAQARLIAEGFEALGSALEDVQQELAADALETLQAFTELEGAAGGWETEAGAAWDEAGAELDRAVAAHGEAASDVEAAAAEAVKGFQSAAAEFEQRCSQLESDVDVIYDALDAAVEEQGREWEREAQRMAGEAVASVQADAQQRLERPAVLLEDEALVALAAEWSSMGAIFDGAAASAGELQPLADELARCQAVVGHIDELLNALAG
jgi:hypothetical protein